MPRLADDLIGRPGSQHGRRATYARYRRNVQAQLSTKKKHYMIMALVALDVSGILADIFVALIACDRQEQDEKWVEDTRHGLEIASLVFSCLFLTELILTVWSFGFRYFSSWFHCFDAVVILVSFISDLLTQGIVEEIASLVIILRLWRFVKIVEELSVGASENMEDIEAEAEQLQRENAELKRKLRALREGDEPV